MSKQQYLMCVLLLLHNTVFAWNLPNWVTNPYLEGGFADTQCYDRDTSEEIPVALAFAEISFDIELRVELSTTSYPKKTDTQLSMSNSSTEENKRLSTESFKRTNMSVGPYVSVRAMTKLIPNNLSNGDKGASISDDFQRTSRILFTDPARSESREVWIHQELSAKKTGTETKINDDTLAWHEVISMLLRSGQYIIYTDYVPFPDGEIRRCSFVGYIVNKPGKN